MKISTESGRQRDSRRCDRAAFRPRLTLPVVSGVVSLALVAAAQVLADDGSLLSLEALVARGMERFRNHDLAGSIRDFESASRREPSITPQLWQLGISYYYAADFKKGRELFEAHLRVNPHDVENAAWHFLCVARMQGVDEARQSLLKLDTRRDQRVPMREVYALYAGEGTTAAVLQAAAAASQPRARMYAHLYLGLYYEVSGEEALARNHMEQAAVQPLGQHYMQDVAKVHLRLRAWDARP